MAKIIGWRSINCLLLFLSCVFYFLLACLLRKQHLLFAECTVTLDVVDSMVSSQTTNRVPRQHFTKVLITPEKRTGHNIVVDRGSKVL